MLVGLPMVYRRAEMKDVTDKLVAAQRMAERGGAEAKHGGSGRPDGQKLAPDSRWKVLRQQGEKIQQAAQRSEQTNHTRRRSSRTSGAPGRLSADADDDGTSER